VNRPGISTAAIPEEIRTIEGSIMNAIAIACALSIPLGISVVLLGIVASGLGGGQ